MKKNRCPEKAPRRRAPREKGTQAEACATTAKAAGGLRPPMKRRPSMRSGKRAGIKPRAREGLGRTQGGSEQVGRHAVAVLRRRAGWRARRGPTLIKALQRQKRDEAHRAAQPFVPQGEQAAPLRKAGDEAVGSVARRFTKVRVLRMLAPEGA